MKFVKHKIMKKNKLLIVLSLISVAVLIFPFDSYAHNCKPQNTICPSETEWLSKLSANYTITYRSIKDRTKKTGDAKRYIFFNKDPDVKNGVKYDIRGGDHLQFGDGKGIIDHKLIYFDNPGFNNGIITSFGCFGTIQPDDSRILGSCLSLRSPGLDAIGFHFSAKPTSKFSIFGEKIKRDITCLPKECPGEFEIYDYLKSSYIFSANLIEGQTEQFKIDFDRNPTNKAFFRYDVFDANTNSLVFSGGSGLGIYRRVYFRLPIVDLSGTTSTYNCNGVINPSTSIITGECKTINYDTTGQVASFYGDFTAVPISK